MTAPNWQRRKSSSWRRIDGGENGEEKKKSDVAFDEIAGLVAQAKLSDEVANELTQKMQQFRTDYRQSYLGLLSSTRSAALWHAVSSALMNR